MTGDASGGSSAPSTGDSGGSLVGLVGTVFGGIGALRHAPGGKGLRATNALLRMMVRQQLVDARLARNRFEFGLRQQYPESPVYGPLTPVSSFTVPAKLSSRQTEIEQALMLHPDSKRLQAKLAKNERRQQRWIGKHPEAEQIELARRSY